MTTPIREAMKQEVSEGGTARLTFQIVDDAGVKIPLSSLSTLKLTLYDEATGSSVAGPFINSRNAQSILNANGCTVAETTVDGQPVTLATLKLSGADNPIVTAGERSEWHVAFFEWTWVGGAGPGRLEKLFRVANLSRV